MFLKSAAFSGGRPAEDKAHIKAPFRAAKHLVFAYGIDITGAAFYNIEVPARVKITDIGAACAATYKRR